MVSQLFAAPSVSLSVAALASPGCLLESTKESHTLPGVSELKSALSQGHWVIRTYSLRSSAPRQHRAEVDENISGNALASPQLACNGN